MILLGDHLVWMKDGNLKHLSELKHGDETLTGQFDKLDSFTTPEEMYIIATESFGKTIIDSLQFNFLDEIYVPLRYSFGERDLEPQMVEHVKVLKNLLLEGDFDKAYIYKNNLLMQLPMLDELNRKAMEKLWKDFHLMFQTLAEKSSKKTMVFKKTQGVHVSRMAQKIGWKLGKHSSFFFHNYSAFIYPLASANRTFFDKDHHRIVSKVNEIKVYQIKYKSKFFKPLMIDSNLIPLVSGVFRTDL